MLDAVTKGFRAAKHKLTGKAELTEANIDDALRDIRVALLEADVELNVARRFRRVSFRFALITHQVAVRR